MKKQKDKTGSRRKILRMSTAILLFLLLTYAVFSFYSPDLRFSYRSLFVDNKTHTFRSGQEFSYAGYKFTASKSFEDVVPNKKDCSELYPGGLFGPTFVWKDANTQDLQPKEDCEKNNADNIVEAKKYKNLIIHIKTKNISNGIRPFAFSWFKVLTPNGKTFDQNSGETKLEPSFEVGSILPGSTREGNSKNIKVGAGDNEFSLVVKISEHAEQIIDLD
ncbi:MAG: hypothetical protein Q7K98_06845 [Candidatus Omnitrophota bacterium]|nr:hypothetical protein [Candidatus Omnitrophota bacterium]